MTYLLYFQKTSGLEANDEKSVVYFGGVPEEVQQEILHLLGFVQDTLPIRYLGVPLSSKNTSIVQFQTLIEKIMGRVKSWTSRFLSYTGRIQVIRSVLFSIQIFWAQIFVMPKKVTHCIEAVCRKFLWSGRLTPPRKL